MHTKWFEGFWYGGVHLQSCDAPADSFKGMGVFPAGYCRIPFYSVRPSFCVLGFALCACVDWFWDNCASVPHESAVVTSWPQFAEPDRFGRVPTINGSSAVFSKCWLFSFFFFFNFAASGDAYAALSLSDVVKLFISYSTLYNMMPHFSALIPII